MVMARVRASFLLRCAIEIPCLAAWAVVVMGYASVVRREDSAAWLGGLIVTARISFVLLGAILPWTIERSLLRRALRDGRAHRSPWFVDIDRRAAAAMDRFHEQTRDNPTIR